MCKQSTYRGGFGYTGPRYRGDITVIYPLFSVLGHNAEILGYTHFLNTRITQLPRMERALDTWFACHQVSVGFSSTNVHLLKQQLCSSGASRRGLQHTTQESGTHLRAVLCHYFHNRHQFGSGTCGAAENANMWRQQRPLFHFLFRSRGLGKREIPFPFPVHVAQESGKYYFRFRCMWLREPGNTISVSGARGIQVAGVSQGTETLAKG